MHRRLSTLYTVDKFRNTIIQKSYPQFIHKVCETQFHATYFDKHLFFMLKVIHISFC